MRKRSIVFTIVVLCLMGIAIIFISQNEEESISDPMNENVEVLNNQEDEDNTRLENNQDEDNLISSESEMDDYNTRRLEPVENEVLMDQMGYGNIEKDKNILPQYVLDELENQLVSVFYDTNQEMDIWMYVKDSSLPASIWIQGKEYAFSFGEYFSPMESEKPEIYLYDINQDGVQDILIRGEAYRNLIRQDVYISNAEGLYTELGDITWKSDSENEFQFTATYEDDYKVHVVAQEYGIDEYIEIGSSFLPVALELEMYDSEKKLLLPTMIEDLQSQAVRYIKETDGSLILRYEAQIWSGYSEYCLGHCFVFDYLVTEDGYSLQNVSLQEFEY